MKAPSRSTGLMRRMLPVGIIAIVLPLLWLNAAGQPVGGSSQRPDTPGPWPAITALPLDQAQAREAFALAENWVARGRVPDSSLPIEVRDLAGVHATVRLDGLTLGQATALVDQPFQLDRTVDMMLPVRKAVAKALEQCRENAQRLNARSPQRPIPTDLADLGPLLHLDLQFAGPPVRLSIESPLDLPRRFRIGEHGLVMTWKQQSAWLFPASALAANLNLQNQIDRLAGQVHLPLDARNQIGKPDGPALFRFECIHLVRLRQDDRPVLLRRGHPPADPSPLNTARLDELMARWADHLIARQVTSGWFAGTYHPTSDQYRPLAAPTAECALVAYALAHYARTLEAGSDRASAARSAALKAVTACCRILLEKPADPTRRPASPLLLADSAACLLALLETPGTATLKKQRDRLAGALLAMQRPDGQFDNHDAVGARQATVPTAALAAFALVRMYNQVRNDQFYKAARKAIDALLEKTEPAHLSAALPWLALAEFELAGLDKPSAALISLRRTLLALLARQVRQAGPDPADPAPDTLGGFLLDETLIPEPTWLSARPLAALAAALRVKNLASDKELPLWLLDVCLGLRFMEQLTMNHQACFYVTHPDRALGAVRSAIWDNRQPPAATALALLAGAELKLSLQAMQ